MAVLFEIYLDDCDIKTNKYKLIETNFNFLLNLIIIQLEYIS